MRKIVQATIRLALCAAAVFGVTGRVYAFSGLFGGGGVMGRLVQSATDGSIDPMNSNNKLGVHIDTGFVVPGSRSDTPSTFTDPISTKPQYVAYRIDLNGRVSVLTSNGTWVLTNRRATRRFAPNGRAYWVYNNKTWAAASQYDNQQLQAQYQNNLAADQERQREQEQKAEATQKLASVNQELQNLPQDQIDAATQRLSLSELWNDRQQLSTLIQVCMQDGIGTAGFQRLASSLDGTFRQQAQNNGAVNVPNNPSPPPPTTQPSSPPGPPELYAGNLGIYYTPVNYPDGTFGARITRAPDQNSPVGQVGLEIGDTIFELDGQHFNRPEDVLAHKDQTTVDVINVRNNQAVQFNIFIP